MLRLKQDCLDVWVADFDRFAHDFLYYSGCYAKALGYSFDPDFESLKIAHKSWQASCEKWEKQLVMPDSKGLSHIKMMAILLTDLACLEWMRDLAEFDGDERNGFVFSGTAEERAEIRRDINGGGGTYLALEFAIAVINYFEQNRTDRVGPFVFRATPDVIHDIFVYLNSPVRDAMSTFLILNALYTRPGNGNGAH
jgi:hypothetical protein